jgi:alkylation response protein AidB-like acyl-CoA dehydrogenase
MHFLDWPFFDESHRRAAAAADAFARAHAAAIDHREVDAACKALVATMGREGLTRWCIPGDAGGALPTLDSRALCLIRETLAWHDGLADFAFAMQGLGSGAITLAGNAAQQAAWLPRVARGEVIAAFALSEPEAGSDVGAMQCAARRDGDHWVLDGEKTWISNGGIAGLYTVFARSDATSSGARGLSAFLVPADTPGLTIAERIDVIAPHPLARLRFANCRIPAANLLGEESQGFKLAMATLDIFRASVAAAAIGFAQRALDESLAHARRRKMFGATLADQPLTQAKLADMSTRIEAARGLTYRAAWRRDTKGKRTTREAAMAKLAATESAQRVIDDAVQLHGALGVTSGHIIERLYRDIRALRIYEGASEVQRLIIGRDLLRS